MVYLAEVVTVSAKVNVKVKPDEITETLANSGADLCYVD